MEQRNLYLLLDSQYTPLARCVLLSAPSAPTWQVRILDDKVDAVLKHETIQLVSMSSQGSDLLGRVIRHRDDQIVLERLRLLGSEVRENFRTPVDFVSFVYPLTGDWKGRREVHVSDLSCGGLTFCCQSPLEDKERLEIVIPTTELPLVLQCEVLRGKSGQGALCYAAQFIHMCNDEEALVRRTVFNIQLQSRGRTRAGSASAK
jgi:hypothetical protein